MSCIKEIAMREPLVDVVSSKAVVTDEFMFKSIDIKTVTKEELSFTVPWSLKCSRSDYVHALLAYFDIEFSGDKVVTFGTGPYEKPTHWKQTVFYLPRDLAVSAGDSIEGTLKCVPNSRNHRHLDISIEYKHTDKEGVVQTEAAMDYSML